MKKIIKGVLYDTEKSEEIYFDVVTERKYYKTNATGRFFCTYANGEIMPMSEDAMKTFLGENDIDKYIELFGEPELA